MKNLPKGIKLHETPSELLIEAKNYDETLLLMQIILMVFPLLVINVYLLMEVPIGMIVSGPLLLSLIYWVVYNIKDNYLVRIAGNRVLIQKGMDKRILLNANLDEILNISIVRRSGKELRSARTGLSSQTPDIDELWVQTPGSEVMITNSLLYSNQVFIKNQIMRQKQCAG